MQSKKREMNEDPVMKRIIQALEGCGSTAKDMLIELGLAKSSFDNWKFGGSHSYMKYLDKIADYTGTTIDYLVRGEDSSSQVLTLQEKEIIKKYRGLNKDRKELICSMIQNLNLLTFFEEESKKCSLDNELGNN